MRGSPLLRALLVFAALLALGVPVWKLTHRSAVASVAEAPAVGEEQELGIEFTFTSPPRSLRVAHLEKELLSAENPGTELQRTFRAEFPKQGVDLHFYITWPTAGTTAVKIVLLDPTGERHEKTIWSAGEKIDDVLTFP